MQSIIIATLCCFLACVAPCCTQPFCSTELWVTDNEMPINKLDISSPSRSKLVQSLRAPDKAIKCSELRLIHKEAELNRPFKQNRYKVKLSATGDEDSRDSHSRRSSNLKDDGGRRRKTSHSHDDRDSQDFRRRDDDDARFDDRHERNSNREDGPSASDKIHDREHRRSSRSQASGSEAEDSRQSLPPDELQNQELQSNSLVDSHSQPHDEQLESVPDGQITSSDETLSSSTIENSATQESQDSALESPPSTSDIPATETENSKLADKDISPAATVSSLTASQNPALETNGELAPDATDNAIASTAGKIVPSDTSKGDNDDSSPANQNILATVEEPEPRTDNSTSSSVVVASNGTAPVTNATETEVTSPDKVLTATTESPTSSDAGANLNVEHEETKMAERLKLYFSEAGNRTKELRASNRTSLPYNDTLNLLLNCTSCPRTFYSAQSWKFCHYFYFFPEKLNILASNELLIVNNSVSILSLSTLITCRTCSSDSQSNPRSNLFCSVFFFSRGKNFTDKVDEHSLSKPNNSFARASVLSCFVCPATSNRTHSICVFLKASHFQSSGVGEHQHQNLADRLHFINDSTVTGSAAEIEQLPIGEGEMQEAKSPTRARHETTKLESQGDQLSAASNIGEVDKAGNQTSISPNATASTSRSDKEVKEHLRDTVDKSVQQGRQLNSNATTSLDASGDIDNTTAKQLDTLSHSIFMEKLFESLLSKRNASLQSAKAVANLTMRVDSLTTRFDLLHNVASLKSNKSDLVELKSLLLTQETKFSRTLARLERQNLQLAERVRKLEAATTAKLLACHSKLSKVKSDLKLLSGSHGAQILQLRRSIEQISRRVQATALPEVPYHRTPETMNQNQQVGHNKFATAALPNLHDELSITDCSDVYLSGRKTGQQFDESKEDVFRLNLGFSRPVQARCDLKNGGWTYILSRSDGKTDFYRNWTSYRTGFGDPSGEYFIGLDTLAEMTSKRHYMLRVDLEDWEGAIKNVSYGQFQVLGERLHFQLRVDNFNGDAGVGDSLTSHSNASFSTYDLDNDLVESKFGGNCATRFHGGFWYFSCYRANPTGRYYAGGKIPDKKCDGIVWKTWKGPHYSLRAFHMKIRPIPFS